MLEFKKTELSLMEKANSYLKRKNYFLCDYSFTDLFIWASVYGTRLAFDDDFMYIRTGRGNDIYFAAPIGSGDYKKAIEKMARAAHAVNMPLKIHSIPKEIKERLEAERPEGFEFTCRRDMCNYIYSAESLMYLKGKRLHGKRNHINRFLKEYEGRWVYEPLTEENSGEVLDYQIKWCKNGHEDVAAETNAVSLALENMKALGIKGGVLRLDGQIIGATLGSESFPDTFTVHIEKAEADIQGAYQMINQQFALHNFEGYRYINREEDLGIEGLRKAKLSYFPESITESFFGEERV